MLCKSWQNRRWFTARLSYVRKILSHRDIHQGLNSPAFFFGDADPLFIPPLFSLRAESFKRTDGRYGVERKNVRTPGNEMPVSIHHQYYLGECPATRYYRGLERRADFIMVSGEREPSNGMWNGRLVGWLVGRLPAWLAGWLVRWLACWLAPAVEVECGEHRRCVPALACVTYKQETACWGDTLLTSASHTAHTCTRTHTRVHYAHARTYVFRRVFYERSIFWGKLFGGFAAGLRRSVFLSRQWRNFH